MATVPRKGEFYDTESASGEWARGENYGDGTTGDQRVAAARAKDYVAPTVEAPAVKMTGSPDMPSSPAKKISFKEAFAAAKDGSTVNWNGKKDNKEYADKKGMSKDVEKFNPTAALPKKSDAPVRSLAPTKNNAAEMDNKLTAERYKGRRAGFDAKMKKTTGGKTTDYAKGGSVRGAGIAQRGVKKCKMV